MCLNDLILIDTKMFILSFFLKHCNKPRFIVGMILLVFVAKYI